MTDSGGEPLGMIAIVSLMAWGLGYFGQPHILARFKAVRDAGFVPKVGRIAMSWVFVSLTAACLVGLVGILIFETSLGDAEKVFIRPVMLHGHFVRTPIFFQLKFRRSNLTRSHVLCGNALS
ncbi:MAG: hypothetical protein KZQ76_00065 [Candidatus Thiodiazotropha sp. (ex Epidulcina cf. delphinae)]|nr:hypothetical protein [Candidatus Thiodiazotropha sp. (ex Epidulcina cf. delphinae)]